MLLHPALELALRDVVGLHVLADVVLVGHGPGHVAADVLQLEEELAVVELHQGAALVAALLGAREPLHEEVGGAEGAQLPQHAPRLRSYRLLAAPNFVDAVGEILDFLLKIV